jgi:hypothetical protein
MLLTPYTPSGKFYFSVATRTYVVTDKTVSFEGGYINRTDGATRTADDIYAVPLAIYGIKGVK